MKNLWIILAMATLLMAGSCNFSRPGSREEDGKLSGNISISGAFALYPITVKWAEEFHKLHPAIQIDISAGGAGKGMADALSGMVDLGMFSREVSPEEKAKGAWHIALTKDAVLPTLHASNPAFELLRQKGVTREQFYGVFVSGRITAWNELTGGSDTENITLFTRSDACGAAAMWASYLGVNQEDLLGLGVFGDPGIADAIRGNRYGLGYNNVAYVYDIRTRGKYQDMEVLPVDLDGNGMITPDEDFYGSLDSLVLAIKEGVYPAPPARELYFVSQGPPEREIVAVFIEWILTEGQQYLGDAGYVTLSEARITEELKRLRK